MRIVHVASELFPYVKTGGLADAVAALTKQLASLGHEVAVILPGYREVLDGLGLAEAEPAFQIRIEMGDEDQRGEVLLVPWGERRRLYLVRRDEFFDRRYPYGVGTRDYEDNAERFIFFDKAAVEILRLARLKADVVHCHDWQTGLVPVLLRVAEQRNDETLALSTVATIHNIAFQGLFPRRAFRETGLPDEFFTMEGVEFYGQLNMLKAAIVFADRITTVSPNYAREMRTAQFGSGLEGVVNSRAGDLVGLLNGLDPEVWNPATDKLLPANYSVANLEGKRTCRRALLEACRFDPAFAGPVFGLVARLAHQKGMDLILAVQDFFTTRPVKFVVLGRGDPRYEHALRELAQRHPQQVYMCNDHDEPMSHLIEAGADFFLMPSIFEPCGLNQMYSMHYGTIPIVTRVGGLVDTVTDIDELPLSGTGIVVDPQAASLREGLERAVRLHGSEETMRAVIRRGMQQDFSWGKAAREYEALYRDIV